jgi:asparagine synthase (glutamine-hydrolysing)
MSGGLDSTSITCLAAQASQDQRAAAARHAFTVLFAEFDESKYVNAVVAQSGVEWHATMCSDQQVIANIDAFIRAHDEPVHSLSAFAGYLVMGIAAESGVKVLLNGQGADELLAGYESAVVPYVRSVQREHGTTAALRAAYDERVSISGLATSMLRVVAGIARSTLPEQLQSEVLAWQYMREPLPLLPEFDQPKLPALPELATWLSPNLLDQQLRAPLPLYLRIEDTNSSAFSMESRLPFLDPEVIALARAAPASLLRRHGWNKYLLREAMRGVLPEVVRTRRDKMGFPIPTERWWRGPLASRVPYLTQPQRLARRGLYDVPRVVAEVRRFEGGAPLPAWLARLLLLELWADRHLDGVA